MGMKINHVGHEDHKGQAMKKTKGSDLTRSRGGADEEKEAWLQHAWDMIYRPRYSAGYYFTILHNINAKASGEPLMDFDPKDPEAVFRKSVPLRASASLRETNSDPLR